MQFGEIEARAADRKGGAKALESLLKSSLPRDKLLAVPDERWLSEMTRSIFQAGFSWELIDKRWPQFEAAFEGFNVTRWLFMSDDDLDHLLKAPGLVANAQKIKSVQGNAQFISEMDKSHGSASAWFDSWPLDRYMELCAELKARGSRLGGATGQRVMRSLGRDAFILTPTVVKALKACGVVAGEPPTSKKDLAAVQDALTAWHGQSGRGLTQMSQILAFSVD
ncbi:MAG TPA: DNA-3-methyladenine glycosylase I [Asticcacaulis sp.]|nr:DNA-3-methyladenine glycosylase I [Asticcacaulis sp.]